MITGEFFLSGCDWPKAGRTTGARVLSELLAERTPSQRVDAAIDELVDDYDAGMLRWCGLLTKAAPLLGLAATLLGVSCSLEEFVRHPRKP